jgi:hypothetical protein
VAGEQKTSDPPTTVAGRFDLYRRTVPEIVERGIEHPQYELKRSVSISEKTAGRMSFVKLMQGVANATISEERFIVVGADHKERKFFPVENAADFDQANVTQILQKYLSPLPDFEVFNSMETSIGQRYVLIVFAPRQPRPIFVVTEGSVENKTHFRTGDVWVKKGTSLQRATREDFDQMYQRAIDEESDKRARRRFDQLREETGTQLPAHITQIMPSPDLLLGGRDRLVSFAETVIRNSDKSGLDMLIEMARAKIVEQWLSYIDPEIPTYPVEGVAENTLTQFYRDHFGPTVQSLVVLGLLVVKYGAATEWLPAIVDLLVESFNLCGKWDWLKSMQQVFPNSVPFARPSYEIYVGVRALGTYAMMRKKYDYLKTVLPRFVRTLSCGRSKPTLRPLMFWPFSGALNLPDMRNGRNQAYWDEYIAIIGREFFSTTKMFLDSAAQLEFVLELSSYLLLHSNSDYKTVINGFEEKDFTYVPDFWVSRLDPTVTVANYFYDEFLGGKVFPLSLAIEPEATETIFKSKTREERLLFLGEFLEHLHRWQEAQLMNQWRAPYLFDWPQPLKDLVNAYLNRQVAPQVRDR